MLCPSCGSDNRETAKFCGECGAKLEAACPACGAAVEAGQKFCDNCGHNLEAAAPPADVQKAVPAPKAAPAQDGERRQVTVLFADISGFTKLSQEHDAEDVHALLNGFFTVADAAIGEYGGHIDKHIGDNVMALFGAPTAHTNDPERAVRAALDIHTAVSELDPPLRVHIGVAAGTVVASGTGSEAHQEYTVTGDTVNLAARLQDAAKAGETLIADEVYQQVSGLFRCESAAGKDLKGIEGPVRAWHVLAPSDSAQRGAEWPLVGRRREVRQLASILDACAETGNGECVYVRGEAGVGKTRLLDEFRRLAEVRGFACHRALILDFGAGKGRDAVRVLVRGLLGLPSSAGSKERAAAAAAAVAAGHISRDRLAHLNDLLDIDQPADLRAFYDAMENSRRNEGKQKVVEELLAAACAAQPVLILVEDLHWADALVLAYLAHLARGLFDYRAVLVMTSRIEGDPLDAAWRTTARGIELSTMDLQPLREKEALEMAATFVGAHSEFVTACVARAEGNPLFLEQLLRSAEEAKAGDVPGSVQSSVLARMDVLDPADRKALQAASVVGQRFGLDLLRHLLGDSNFSCVPLIEHYLVRPEGEEYLFSHALIRDGAYASLLKPNRRDLHERAAGWFEERDPVLHAEHLERAESPAAPGAYHRAAEQALGGFRYEVALRLCTQGLEIADSGSDKYALLCMKGDVNRDLGDSESSILDFRAALGVADSDPERSNAHIGIAEGMRVLDQYDEALDMLERAEATAGDDRRLGRIHHLRGNIFFPLGNIDGCLEQHELARGYFQAVKSPEGEAQTLSGLGDAYYQRGHMITAYQHFDESLKMCREHGLVRLEIVNMYMRGSTRFYQLDIRGAIEESLAAGEMAVRLGQRRAELVSRTGGIYMLDAGDLDGAKSEMERCLEISQQLGARRFEPWAYSSLARVEAHHGNHEKAEALALRAVEIAHDAGVTFLGPICLSVLAGVTRDPGVREKSLAEADELLARGCVSHNYFSFYPAAMDIVLRLGEWDEADRYAGALEDYTRGEPLPLCDYYIAWGRALAAHGRGDSGDANRAELKRLKKLAADVSLATALPHLEAALGADLASDAAAQ